MALIVENVRKSYGNLKVLDGVSFLVDKGEFVCIIGESGCGKTTILKIIAGIEEMDDGKITFESERMKIGFVFQDDRLLPWKTVYDNIMFAVKAAGVNLNSRMLKKLLETVGLSGFENYYPKQLSGGMRQRAGIARALAIQPDLLLMDEPFASIDAQTRERMQEELLKIVEGKTVVFVTHSIDEAIFLADRIVVFSPRPAKVLKVVEIDMPKPRDRTSERFVRLKREIYKALSGW